MNTARTPLLLRTVEAAQVLAVSPRTLWSLTNEGVIPCVRLGKSVRYSVETLRAVIAERQRGSEEEVQRAYSVLSHGRR